MGKALGELRVNLIANNEIVPELTKTNTQLEANRKQWNESTGDSEKSQKKLAKSSASSRVALRQLSSSVAYLGVSFVGMGAAMEKSNNATVKNVGGMLSFVGGIMTAVGSSVQFISSIGRMISALNKLRNAEILAQAFSGPAGWGTLLAGAAIAGGVTYGVTKLASSSNSSVASASSSSKQVIEIHTHLDGREIYNGIKPYAVKDAGRNGTTGIR